MRTLVCAALAITFASLAGTQSTGAQELRTIRYGFGQDQGGTGGAQDQVGLGALGYIVAQREGFLEKEGVRLEPFRTTARPAIGNQATLFEAMAKGEFDMTRSQLSFLILHVLKGFDFAAVSGSTANQMQVLIARPEIKTFADLKGKTIALTWPYDLISLVTLKLMEKHGVKKDDVRIKVMTGSGPRAECLRSGECAAAAVSNPYDLILTEQGNHALGNSHELDPMLFIAEVVNRSWAEKNQDTVARYIRGMAATQRFINDPKNADEIRPIIMQITQSSDAAARNLLSTYFYNQTRPYLPRQAELDADAFGRAVALMAEYGEIPNPPPPTSRFIDLRYAKAAGVQ
jgi:ABC-type nitrate/sulfonate/bicarbonate transport system substrate-binding protein